MAQDKKVVIGATITTDAKQATDTVDSYRAMLRRAKEELLANSAAYGQFSKEAQFSAKLVAELKDEMDDANSLVAAFNPDRKFAAFAQSVQGVVGGFTALQGVMGLVGAESEDVQKALLKIQSALAISQGLDQLREAQQGFKNLGAMIKNSTLFVKANEAANKAAAFSMKLFGGAVETTSTSFKVLKGAIAATGIGLLLVLIGEAVAFFNELSSAAEKAAEEEKRALEMREKYASAGLSGRVDEINRQNELLVAQAKVAGKTEKEILDIEQGSRKLRIKALQDFIDEVGVTSEKGEEAQKQLRKEQTQGQIDDLNFQAGVNKKRLDELKGRNDKEAQAEKQRLENLKKQHDQEIQEAHRLRAELDKTNNTGANATEASEVLALSRDVEAKRAILQKAGESEIELEIFFAVEKRKIREKYAEEERIAAENKVSFFETVGKNINRVNIVSEEARTQTEKDAADGRKKIAQEEMQAKMDFINLGASLADAAGELAGKQTAAGKALAVAATLMSTYTAAQKAYESQFLPLPNASSPIRGAIAAATAVISGIARVKAILAVKVPGGSGGSVPSISGGAPLSPSLSNSTTSLNPNQVNQINQQGNQAVRAFVVETDVTSGQERIRRINRAARLG